MGVTGRTAGLFLVILALSEALAGFGQNELVVLPFARQAVDRGWLPTDWWLNHNPTYCWLFNQIFGRLAIALGFAWTAILGRLAADLLLAVALERSIRALDLPYVLGLLALVFYLTFPSLAAYEWIVSGLEAKAFAYPLAILALAFHMEERHRAGFLCLGLAMSFHSLVGFYATFTTVVALAVTRRRLDFAWSAWAFLTTGAIGILELLRGALPARGIDTTGIWDIYVLDRAPHHLYPSTWKATPWVTEITVLTLFLAVSAAFLRSRTARLLATYALVAMSLFFFGVFVWLSGDIPLLRAYWFRFPDTMGPLAGFLLAGLWLREGTRADRLLDAFVLRSLSIAAAALALGLVPRVVMKVTHQASARSWENPATASMDAWIRENTPRDAIFLISPARDDFYVHAERAIVVSFKACPQQDPVAMVEWFDRLQRINAGRPYQGRGFERMAEIRRAYEKLDEETVRALAARYGVRYFLAGKAWAYDLPVAHQAGDLVLYEIPSATGVAP